LCASRSPPAKSLAFFAFGLAVLLSTLAPRGSFTEVARLTGSSQTQQRQPSWSAMSSSWLMPVCPSSRGCRHPTP
jgi:hypothetical protein